MSSLLSAISGKFSTNLILGTFFPVTVFVFLARVLWVPLLPAGFHPALVVPLAGLDEKWELLVLTLVTIVLSGLLYNLNIPLIQFYEGYPWMDTWIGRRKTERYQAELRTLEAQKGGAYPLAVALREEVRTRRAATANDPRAGELQDWAAAAAGQESVAMWEIFARFPNESSILPTRLGNTIRSFENYPERQYGMASITLWPRLIAVLDSGYAETIDSAKASFDFMLNSATLAGLLALLLLTTGLFYPAPLTSHGSTMGWLGEVVLLATLAWWFYAQSIGRASEWGNLVRGAFDLYRGKLLEKLGYAHAPKTAEVERKLWRAISSRLVAGDPPPGAGEIPPYATDPPSATSCRGKSIAALPIARGIIPLPGGCGLYVVLEARNPRPQGAPVEGLVVVDTVPDGYDFLWGSVVASEGTVTVEGCNPYSFQLSDALAPGAVRQLTYYIIPRVTRGRSPGGGHEF